MSLVITGLRPEDIPQIYAIEQLSFETPWSLRSLEEELVNPFARYFVCRQGDRVLGYVGTRVLVGECHVANVAVHPGWRRRGVASRMMAALVAYAQAEGLAFITLEVRASNQGAIALYEKFGFAQQGVRPGYYENPREDALLMTRYFAEQNGQMI